MEPIKIGWLGAALDGPGGGYDKIHRMAFDEAIEPGLLDRPVEFVLHAENGLPQRLGEERDRRLPLPRRRGLHRRRRRVQLRQRDHRRPARQRAPGAAHQLVRAPSGSRATTASGSATATVGGDAALVVGVAEAQGHERVAVLSEISPNGEEYFRFFRQECRRRGVRIAAVETVSQSPDDLADEPRQPARRSSADALVYMGYGMLAAKGLLREALDELAWDPPRIMGTAFMFYLMGFDKFEGWVGIDQLDPTQPARRRVPRAVRRRATARTRRCGRTRSRCSRTTPRACSSRACSARRSSRARA